MTTPGIPTRLTPAQVQSQLMASIPGIPLNDAFIKVVNGQLRWSAVVSAAFTFDGDSPTFDSLTPTFDSD
jgi:hypothetical protein